MWNIWKQEIYKTASRKILWLGLLLLLLIVHLRLYEERSRYSVTIDGQSYSGHEAIEKDQALTAAYAGILTEEKVHQIYQEFGFYYYDPQQDQTEVLIVLVHVGGDKRHILIALMFKGAQMLQFKFIAFVVGDGNKIRAKFLTHISALLFRSADCFYVSYCNGYGEKKQEDLQKKREKSCWNWTGRPRVDKRNKLCYNIPTRRVC